jgi:glycosyltransferase involved in cell wall biosynthesis
VPINPALKPTGLSRKDYLLYLGRVIPYKGVLESARVAHLLRRKLIVAGPAAGDYADKIAAMVPDVLMVGEVKDPYRSQLIEQAWAMMNLFNSTDGWQEPGCGTTGESMAFNTPVAIFPNGVLPEQVIDGQNGWVASTVDDMATNMEYAPYPATFAPFQEKFGVENIVRQYLDLYREVCNGKTWG